MLKIIIKILSILTIIPIYTFHSFFFIFHHKIKKTNMIQETHQANFQNQFSLRLFFYIPFSVVLYNYQSTLYIHHHTRVFHKSFDRWHFLQGLYVTSFNYLDTIDSVRDPINLSALQMPGRKGLHLANLPDGYWLFINPTKDRTRYFLIIWGCQFIFHSSIIVIIPIYSRGAKEHRSCKFDLCNSCNETSRRWLSTIRFSTISIKSWLFVKSLECPFDLESLARTSQKSDREKLHFLSISQPLIIQIWIINLQFWTEKRKTSKITFLCFLSNFEVNRYLSQIFSSRVHHASIILGVPTSVMS